MSNIFRRAILLTVAGAGLALLQTPAKAWDGHPPAVSPAIAPGSPSAPSQEGKSGIESRGVYLCLFQGQVIRMEYGTSVYESATIRHKAAGGAVSFLNIGVGGGFVLTNVNSNFPEDKFTRISERERNNAIINCEALKKDSLYQEEVQRALRARRIQDRGDVTGFAASEAAQQAYLKARRDDPNHPKLAAADQAASEGRYEDAIRLVSNQ